MSEIKYFRQTISDEAECSRNVASGRRVAGAIRSLANARVLHESLLMHVFMYGDNDMEREGEV